MEEIPWYYIKFAISLHYADWMNAWMMNGWPIERVIFSDNAKHFLTTAISHPKTYIICGCTECSSLWCISMQIEGLVFVFSAKMLRNETRRDQTMKEKFSIWTLRRYLAHHIALISHENILLSFSVFILLSFVSWTLKRFLFHRFLAQTGRSLIS